MEKIILLKDKHVRLPREGRLVGWYAVNIIEASLYVGKKASIFVRAKLINFDGIGEENNIYRVEGNDLIFVRAGASKESDYRRHDRSVQPEEITNKGEITHLIKLALEQQGVI